MATTEVCDRAGRALRTSTRTDIGAWLTFRVKLMLTQTHTHTWFVHQRLVVECLLSTTLLPRATTAPPAPRLYPRPRRQCRTRPCSGDSALVGDWYKVIQVNNNTWSDHYH